MASTSSPAARRTRAVQSFQSAAECIVVFVSFVQWASDDLEPKVVKFKRGKGWGNWYYSLQRWTQKDNENMVSAAEAVTKELRAVMADMEGSNL